MKLVVFCTSAILLLVNPSHSAFASNEVAPRSYFDDGLCIQILEAGNAVIPEKLMIERLANDPVGAAQFLKDYKLIHSQVMLTSIQQVLIEHEFLKYDPKLSRKKLLTHLIRESTKHIQEDQSFALQNVILEKFASKIKNVFFKPEPREARGAITQTQKSNESESGLFSTRMTEIIVKLGEYFEPLRHLQSTVFSRQGGKSQTENLDELSVSRGFKGRVIFPYVDSVHLENVLSLIMKQDMRHAVRAALNAHFKEVALDQAIRLGSRRVIAQNPFSLASDLLNQLHKWEEASSKDIGWISRRRIKKLEELKTVHSLDQHLKDKNASLALQASPKQLGEEFTVADLSPAQVLHYGKSEAARIQTERQYLNEPYTIDPTLLELLKEGALELSAALAPGSRSNAFEKQLKFRAVIAAVLEKKAPTDILERLLVYAKEFQSFKEFVMNTPKIIHTLPLSEQTSANFAKLKFLKERHRILETLVQDLEVTDSGFVRASLELQSAYDQLSSVLQRTADGEANWASEAETVLKLIEMITKIDPSVNAIHVE